jgi:hypothetical protein
MNKIGKNGIPKNGHISPCVSKINSASVSLDRIKIDTNNPTAAPTTVNNLDLDDSCNPSNIKSTVQFTT